MSMSNGGALVPSVAVMEGSLSSKRLMGKRSVSSAARASR
jgi:hypothetical protein